VNAATPSITHIVVSYISDNFFVIPSISQYFTMATSSHPEIEVLSLTPEHLADVTRLHRFSSSAAGSVFGSRDFTVVLEAAAAGSDG
jgi:hypothetical protein